MFGVDLDEETLKDIDKMNAGLEELQEAIKASAGRKRSAKEEAKVKKLKADFKRVAGETIRELYGYYNTETGSTMSGESQEPLSQEERRQLDREIDGQLDTTLDMLEKLATMTTSEYMGYVSSSFSGLSSLFGGSGLDVPSSDELRDMSDQDLVDWLGGGAGGSGAAGDAAGDLMTELLNLF